MRHVAPRSAERSRHRLVVLAFVAAAVVIAGVVVCVPALVGRFGHPPDSQTAVGRPLPSAAPTTGAGTSGAAEPAGGDTAAVDLPGAVAGASGPHLTAWPVDPQGRASYPNPVVTSALSDATPGSPTGRTGGSVHGADGTVPGMATPTAGSWVSVDSVAQAAATEAFLARTPAAIPGGAVMVPEFHATCTVSHHNNDDPIVFPGQTGVAHHHTFIGNETTDAASTVDSLLAGATTCDPAQDHSAYWIPSLYDGDGDVVDPYDITVYYGSDVEDSTVVQPFPLGLRMITGDAANQDPLPQGNFWCSGPDADAGRTADGVFPICGEDSNLVRQISFPQCWDGVHLDSPDHEAHMAQPVNGTCPADHPVAVPALSYVLRYPKSLGHDPSGITLASGNTYSMHADFINAWEVDALAQRVRDCLNQHVKCAADGGF